MTFPYKQNIGDKEYTLGEQSGERIQYDLNKTLIYLEALGKERYGIGFKIHKADQALVHKLLVYFVRDRIQSERYEINLQKGILLVGRVGTGKTSLMKLIPRVLPFEPFKVKSCRQISYDFFRQGPKIMADFDTTGTMCFDDLGSEIHYSHYGTQCNVMAEILMNRYDLFIAHKTITHLTTNLNAVELEKRYGQRVRSRMRSMFNVLSFEPGSTDKRL